jgi:hypothetical protein
MFSDKQSNLSPQALSLMEHPKALRLLIDPNSTIRLQGGVVAHSRRRREWYESAFSSALPEDKTQLIILLQFVCPQ